MTTTTVVDSPLGNISITLNSRIDSTPTRIYIYEFLGNAFPPHKLREVVNGFITLPGYGGMSIKHNLPDESLCWQAYGDAVATLLKHSLKNPVGLLGNSMGAMIAIYAALKQSSAVDHLILYRVPTFGELRGDVHGKYRHVANSIVDKDTFENFINRIDSEENLTFVQTLKAVGWQGAKKLYASAAISDLESSLLKNINIPVYFLINPKEIDEIHPKTAQEKMVTLMTGTSTKEFIQLKDLKNTLIL